MDETALPAPAPPQTIGTPTRHEMNVLVEMANAAASAGFGVAGACLIKMLFGRSMGIDPTASLSCIDLIPSAGGIRPGMNAATQIAMIRRRGLGDIRLLTFSPERCTVEAWRNDDNRKFQFSFGRDEAQKAGLLHKDNYKKWEQSMYIARAQALASHALFQEAFVGLMYTPDELGAETDEDGRMLALPEPSAKLDGPETAGIQTRKKEAPNTDQVVERAVAAVETMKAGGEAQLPSTDAIDVEAEPPAPTEGEKLRLLHKDRIKRLAADVLKLSAPNWKLIRDRFVPADREATLDELERIECYMHNLARLRFYRNELATQLSDEKWAAALKKRGATADIELGEFPIVELLNKLAENLTPFSRAKCESSISLSLGHTPTVDSNQGNC